MNERRRQYVSGRARPESSHGSWARWIVAAAVIAVAFAVGIALGVALERGPGAKGVQTQERTLQVMTVTITNP